MSMDLPVPAGPGLKVASMTCSPIATLYRSPSTTSLDPMTWASFPPFAPPPAPDEPRSDDLGILPRPAAHRDRRDRPPALNPADIGPGRAGLRATPGPSSSPDRVEMSAPRLGDEATRPGLAGGGEAGLVEVAIDLVN